MSGCHGQLLAVVVWSRRLAAIAFEGAGWRRPLLDVLPRGYPLSFLRSS